jgi:beta-N-acetylhexosaminidase
VRSYEQIDEEDLKPFRDAIEHGAEAVMMAHVRYPLVDDKPAGYSRKWIEDVLRGELVFRGAVFSDDIGMAAAYSAGGIAERIDAHLDAGCDVVLVCPPALVADSLAAMERRPTSNAAAIVSLLGRGPAGWSGLLADTRYHGARATLGLGDAAGGTA